MNRNTFTNTNVINTVVNKLTVGQLRTLAADFAERKCCTSLDTLKFSSKAQLKLSPHFLAELIVYSFLTRFPILLSETSLTKQTRNSSITLKSHYQAYQDLRNCTQAYFQCILILHVKLVRHFIEEQFEEIQIDQQQQAEIYVMLLFAIIGLEVSIHTYPVILAKHLSIITKQDNNQIPVHKGKLPNLPLESLAFYPSLRQKRKRKGTFRCSLRLEQDNLQPLEYFRRQIRENLNVVLSERSKPQRVKITLLENSAPQTPRINRCHTPITKKHLSHKTNLNSEQISAALQYELASRKLPYIYTKRNVVVRKKFKKVHIDTREYITCQENCFKPSRNYSQLVKLPCPERNVSDQLP